MTCHFLPGGYLYVRFVFTVSSQSLRSLPTYLVGKSRPQSPDPLGRYDGSCFPDLVCRCARAYHCGSLMDHAVRSNCSVGRKRRPSVQENFCALLGLDSAGGSAIDSLVQTPSNRAAFGGNRKPWLITKQANAKVEYPSG